MPSTIVYQDIEWREVGEKPIEKENWPRNKTCPQTGEKRWIRKTHRYIDAPVGGRVWLLYQPGLSLFNGWQYHPEELDQSALVEVEISNLQHPIWALEEDEKFYAKHPDLARSREERLPDGRFVTARHSPYEWKGWAKVSCLRVVPFAQIPKEFPTVEPDENSNNALKRATQHEATTVTLHNIEDQEVNIWWITTNGFSKYVVLYCLDICGDPIEVCNYRLLSTSGE
ncbi:MAG TPA: hypothetical protein VF627_13850 [Abditibacterium sp.]|jgi:hypothetical protein